MSDHVNPVPQDSRPQGEDTISYLFEPEEVPPMQPDGHLTIHFTPDYEGDSEELIVHFSTIRHWKTTVYGVVLYYWSYSVIHPWHQIMSVHCKNNSPQYTEWIESEREKYRAKILDWRMSKRASEKPVMPPYLHHGWLAEDVLQHRRETEVDESV